MRRRIYLSLLALFLLILSGCGESFAAETRILVYIQESGGFTVENNGQYIQPGEDAVFLLDMEAGVSLADTDYNGASHIAVVDGQVRLTLENVQYPTHAALRLTTSYAVITYEANGGNGETTTLIHDTTNHLRPNTSNGDGLFTRNGYTLESWNTQPDGTGERIGLGSRVSATSEGLTLYAQWAQWSSEEDFDWVCNDDGVTITGYHGNDPIVVIPAAIGGQEVTAIAAGAFQNCSMTGVILSNTMVSVEDGAFQNCGVETLTLFDNIESIGDDAFLDCEALKTLRINAVEEPYGMNYRKECCYADKVELLLQAQGEKKIVFYGGCSMWYNLDSSMLTPLLERGYTVINMGLNGMANSSIQMQILGYYLEAGDIFFHTPEISSAQQMMVDLTMEENGDKLWCGIEYNYDLFTLVDLRTVSSVLDSFCSYLSIKKSGTDYTSAYIMDGNIYCDAYGCIPFYRDESREVLVDEVHMDPSYMSTTAMARLQAVYDQYQEQGVRIYVSYACMNMDAVLEEEQNNVEMVEQRFRQVIGKMDGPVLISRLQDFLYENEDFYDTNYHLLSEPSSVNTGIWLRDLQAQMELDGLW